MARLAIAILMTTLVILVAGKGQEKEPDYVDVTFEFPYCDGGTWYLHDSTDHNVTYRCYPKEQKDDQ